MYITFSPGRMDTQIAVSVKGATSRMTGHGRAAEWRG